MSLSLFGACVLGCSAASGPAEGDSTGKLQEVRLARLRMPEEIIDGEDNIKEGGSGDSAVLSFAVTHFQQSPQFALQSWCCLLQS